MVANDKISSSESSTSTLDHLMQDVLNLIKE